MRWGGREFAPVATSGEDISGPSTSGGSKRNTAELNQANRRASRAEPSRGKPCLELTDARTGQIGPLWGFAAVVLLLPPPPLCGAVDKRFGFRIPSGGPKKGEGGWIKSKPHTEIENKPSTIAKTRNTPVAISLSSSHGEILNRKQIISYVGKGATDIHERVAVGWRIPS